MYLLFYCAFTLTTPLVYTSFLMFLSNFLSLFIFLVICLILGFIIFFIPYLFAQKLDDKDKLAAYECGFSPFVDSRSEFDVKFYLVGMNEKFMVKSADC